VLDVGSVTLLGFAELAAVLVAVYAAVLAGYAWAALRARHLLRSARAARRVNQAAAVAMAGASVAVATR
jgi:threonine/homoserine/homoserine lactone efflux protein